jgi:hypothetical protein
MPKPTPIIYDLLSLIAPLPIKPLAKKRFLFIFAEKMFVKCQINATFAVRFPKGLPKRSENNLIHNLINSLQWPI